jgi:hypothetical protein
MSQSFSVGWTRHDDILRSRNTEPREVHHSRQARRRVLRVSRLRWEVGALDFLYGRVERAVKPRRPARASL